GHQRTGHATFENAALVQVQGHDVKQLVAVHFITLGVHHHHPVAVAVEGNAQISTLLHDRLAECTQMSGTDTVVDIQPVRVGADGGHRGSQLLEHTRRHLVRCPMGAIEHYLHALEA